MFTFCRTSAVVLAVAAMCLAAAAQGPINVPPVSTTGPYPVACTNVEQDFSRVPGDETAEMYWRGDASGGKERYVDALLAAPASALVSTFVAPSDEDLYDRWAGKQVTYVFLACYPTTTANTRADYPLPGAGVVPRMQRGSEAPILSATPARLPVLLYSHGYGGSPLTGNYLRAMISFYATPCSDHRRSKRSKAKRTSRFGASSSPCRRFVRYRSRPDSTSCSHVRSGAIASTRIVSAHSALAREARRSCFSAVRNSITTSSPSTKSA